MNGTVAIMGDKSSKIVQTTRTLILGLDAIPYRLVKQLVEQNEAFSNFRGPTAVTSTFPSISDTAWSTLMEPLGSTRPEGYEARHFDAKKKKLKGGWDFSESAASWRNTFDWRLHGMLFEMLAYGFPRRCCLGELRHGLDAFAASSAAIFSMYVVSTDGLAHLQGPDALTDMLRVVDAELKQFKTRHPDVSFNTIMLSDHGIDGGEPLVNCWPAVRHQVERAGFRIRSRLKSDRDVVFAPYGLLTSFVLYSNPKQSEALADAVAQTLGVDIAVVRTGENAWRLSSPRERATFERRSNGAGRMWRYRCDDGDPLEYAPVIAKLRQRADDETAEWFPDRWWFEATAQSYYPDALYRLARSFELTDASPTVVCSCADGYMYGSVATERIARMTVGPLRWTHGALHRNASLGFMMSDVPDWDAPAMVRAEEALRGFTKVC